MKTTLILLLAVSVYMCYARSLTFPIRIEQTHGPNPGSSRYARNVEDASTPTPLLGDFYSIVVNVSVVNDVNPGQYYRLVVDTGSQITALTSPSVKLPIFLPHYFSGSNTTIAIPCAPSVCKITLPCANTCNFSQGYLGSQSIVGDYYTGSVTLAGVTANNIPFGVITQASSSFGAFADGIMGLGRVNASSCANTFSGICFPNFVQAFAAAGAISSPNFGFALDYNGNGQMVIGGDNPSLYTSALTYFPMYSDALYYTTCNSMFVGNASLGVTIKDFGNTLFDSGTSYIYLPDPVFGKMSSAFQANYPNVTGVSGPGNMFISSSNCFSTDMRDQLPPLVFTIEATQVIVSPYAYILPTVVNTKTQYCLGVASLSQGTSNVPTTIFGAAFMRGKYLYHDVTNGRIGISSIQANVSSSSSSGVWTTITSTTGTVTSDAVQSTNMIMMMVMVAVSIVMGLF